MTVTYTGEVATSKGFGCFLKLLFRWRGSIYKLVWPDLLVFLAIYFTLSILYRFGLDKEQQIIFEKLSNYCDDFGNLIPVSFVLGFYVSIVVGRWWDQYQSIPWTDSIAVFVSAYIHGDDEKGRVIRRTIMRYCCLSVTMTFALISPRVKKRFPSLQHLVEAGLLMENEMLIIEELNRNVPKYTKSWLPVVWACSIVTRARKEGKIRDDFAVKTLLDELNTLRSNGGKLISYDWISVPLVYTQVVTLATYTYFFAKVMGSQWILPKDGSARYQIDLVFPIFTTLQFFFYMGWLKVAESLVNPFGEDDDDFELNWLVDRNLQVAYLIVDEMHHEHPELLKDQYWDEVFPLELPYTVASEQYRNVQPEHSTDHIKVSETDGEIISSHKLDEMSEPSEVGGRRMSSRMSLNKRGSVLSRRERTYSVRSGASHISTSTLADSVSGKMSRTTSITSVLKRMFSRDRERNNSVGSSTAMYDSRAYDMMGSNTNVPRNVMGEVIPELDENMTTIISMSRDRKAIPTVQEIFKEETPASIPGRSQSLQQEDVGVALPPNPKKFYISMSVPADSHFPNKASSCPATPEPPAGDSGPDHRGGSSGSTASLDETMSDLLPLKSSAFSESREKLSKRLAKTFGLETDDGGNSKEGEAEEHLLSDMSLNKDRKEEKEKVASEREEKKKH